MDEATFAGIKRYVGFDTRTSATLRSVSPRVASAIPAIIDDFYATIEGDPDARVAITGGKEQIARLKHSLEAWLRSSLDGPHDAAWVARRERIGLVHVRVGLQQRFMLTAMARIRTGLIQALHAVDPSPSAARADAERALHQLLDVELAVMLDAYHSYLSEGIRSHERLATIGQLAASVGHELRNPLGIIESSLYLAQQRLKKLDVVDPQLEKHHHKIQKQIGQCSAIIKNLLDLARDRPPRRKAQLLHPLLLRATEDLALDTKLVFDVDEDLQVDVDEDDFGHLMSNLIGNASEAMGGGGTVTVRGARRGGGTELTVTDEGPGVPSNIRDRIFDALFTTKARGTGLGLALCRRIVRAHAGELELISSGKGACFRLWFPDSPAEPASSPGS